MLPVKTSVKEAVYMKVDSERKARWERAAASLGLGLSSFLADAADCAAERAETEMGANMFHMFIRNLSHEATRGEPRIGQNSGMVWPTRLILFRKARQSRPNVSGGFLFCGLKNYFLGRTTGMIT